MVQSVLEGVDYELSGVYGGECMMRNIPDLSGKIEKMFFLWRGRDRRCGKFPNLSGAWNKNVYICTTRFGGMKG